jgi:uncharacterized protein (TIGR00369 family)
MASESTLVKTVSVVNKLPDFLRKRVLSLLTGRTVPFVGTTGLRIVEMTDRRVEIVLPNYRRVRNHIGGVHAAAMALLAETATGFVFGMNLPPGKLPLLKSMKVDFNKRTRGGMRAVATLAPEHLEKMKTEERGDVQVDVRVTDQTGEEPIQCTMIWAWVPKKKRVESSR